MVAKGQSAADDAVGVLGRDDFFVFQVDGDTDVDGHFVVQDEGLGEADVDVFCDGQLFEGAGLFVFLGNLWRGLGNGEALPEIGGDVVIRHERECGYLGEVFRVLEFGVELVAGENRVHEIRRCHKVLQ